MLQTSCHSHILHSSVHKIHTSWVNQYVSQTPKNPETRAFSFRLEAHPQFLMGRTSLCQMMPLYGQTSDTNSADILQAHQHHLVKSSVWQMKAWTDMWLKLSSLVGMSRLVIRSNHVRRSNLWGSLHQIHPNRTCGMNCGEGTRWTAQDSNNPLKWDESWADSTGIYWAMKLYLLITLLLSIPLQNLTNLSRNISTWSHHHHHAFTCIHSSVASLSILVRHANFSHIQKSTGRFENSPLEPAIQRCIFAKVANNRLVCFRKFPIRDLSGFT